MPDDFIQHARGHIELSTPSWPANLMQRAEFHAHVAEWLVADMRALALHRRFDGVLAWDSFFRLHMDDQRAMFAHFAAHAAVGAPLMFTSGTSEGEAIGAYCDEQLYHASVDAAEYEQLLASNGFSLRAHLDEDPECGHAVWLATYGERATVSRQPTTD